MPTKSVSLFTLAAALLAGSISAHAQTITNPSFETPATAAQSTALSNQGYYNGAPSNFTGYNTNNSTDPIGAQTFSNGGFTQGGTAAGTSSLFINPNGIAGVGVYQDLGQLQANTLYTLTYAATTGANYLAGRSVTETASFYNGVDPTGSLLNSNSVTLNGANHQFTDYTLTYSTGANVSGDFTLLLSRDGNSGGGQAAFDNLRLSITPIGVPEPSTWAAMSLFLGLLGLKYGRRFVRA